MRVSVLASGTHGVRGDADGAQDAGEAVQRGQLATRARPSLQKGYELVGMYTDEHHSCDAKYTYARSGCAGVGVVGLVGRVADVAPEEGGLNLVPRRRGRVQALHGPLRAALEAAATATEDVADDVGTLKGGGEELAFWWREARTRAAYLRVAAQHQLGVGAAAGVGRDLADAVGHALIDRGTVGGVEGSRVLDVLKAAAGNALADGVDGQLLAAWVRLGGAASQEDVYVLAGGLALLECSRGGEDKRSREKES